MKIIINVWSLPIPDDKTIIYDEKQNVCLLEGKPVKTDVKTDMQVILDCLAGAPLEMSMPVMDGWGCRIEIEKDGSVREYKFSNSFPKGFDKVLSTISKLPRYNEPSKEWKRMRKYF